MNPELNIHFLRQSELGGVCALMEKAFPDFENPRQRLSSVFSREADKPVVLVATVDEKIAGAVTCHGVPGSGFYMIGHLVVDPALRGRGIGNSLMQEAEQFIARAWMGGQPEQVTLVDETKKGNPGSRFYEHQGYELDPNFPPDDAALPYLRKILNKPEPGR